MFTIKQASRSAATLAVIVTIGTVSANSAQAAIINGQVSGIWGVEDDGPGGYQVGDPFTALYTYDDASIVTTNTTTNEVVSGPSGTRSTTLIKQDSLVPLLSLIVNSGSVSQVLALTPFTSVNFIVWYNSMLTGNDFGGSPLNESILGTSINVGNFGGSSSIQFSANREIRNSNGIISDISNALAQDIDFSTSPPTNLLFARTESPIAFSTVPTPALLPGLMGLGLGALRRRKAQLALEKQSA
jgi:hypothetical protein